MILEDSDMAAVLQDLEGAVQRLESAQGIRPAALQNLALPADAPEVGLLEELLNSATHETASSLAFLLQDIRALLRKIAARQRFPCFTVRQIERITEQGWSTPLVEELHRELPSLSLPELSALVKQLCAEWSKIPRIADNPQ
jgi:hypothetical protein